MKYLTSADYKLHLYFQEEAPQTKMIRGRSTDVRNIQLKLGTQTVEVALWREIAKEESVKLGQCLNITSMICMLGFRASVKLNSTANTEISVIT